MLTFSNSSQQMKTDDTHYWWSQMPEPKRFMMVPNAEHSLITGVFEAVPAVGAFLQVEKCYFHVQQSSFILVL